MHTEFEKNHFVHLINQVRLKSETCFLINSILYIFFIIIALLLSSSQVYLVWFNTANWWPTNKTKYIFFSSCFNCNVFSPLHHLTACCESNIKILLELTALWANEWVSERDMALRWGNFREWFDIKNTLLFLQSPSFCYYSCLYK